MMNKYIEMVGVKDCLIYIVPYTSIKVLKWTNN